MVKLTSYNNSVTENLFSTNEEGVISHESLNFASFISSSKLCKIKSTLFCKLNKPGYYDTK